MTTAVRLASAFDVERVAPLLDAYRQFYAQPADIDCARIFLRDRFAHQESVVLIAADDAGAAIGFAQLYPLFSTVRAARTYLLNDLFVVPLARRRGVAGQLLAAAVDFARANGAASLSLQTANDNEPARALYESQGWVREEYFAEYTLAV
ncbi:MAG: GNAT family N-acetyltransferase [Rudaea sp.]